MPWSDHVAGIKTRSPVDLSGNPNVRSLNWDSEQREKFERAMLALWVVLIFTPRPFLPMSKHSRGSSRRGFSREIYVPIPHSRKHLRIWVRARELREFNPQSVASNKNSKISLKYKFYIYIYIYKIIKTWPIYIQRIQNTSIYIYTYMGFKHLKTNRLLLLIKSTEFWKITNDLLAYYWNLIKMGNKCTFKYKLTFKL